MKTLLSFLAVFLNPRTWEGALVYAVLLAFGAVISARVVRLLAQRALMRRGPAHIDRTVVQFLTQLSVVIIYILALTVFLHIVPALQKLGTALLTGVSVASVVIGLAAQNTLGNFIAGCSLVLYRPFEVDDIVEVTGPASEAVIGVIERISLGYTILRTLDDRRLIMPNNLMASQVAITGNHVKLRAMAIVPAAVKDPSQLGTLRAMMIEAAKAHEGVLSIIACLERPLEPEGAAISMRLWCRSEVAAAKASIDIAQSLRQKAKARHVDLVLTENLPPPPKPTLAAPAPAPVF